MDRCRTITAYKPFRINGHKVGNFDIFKDFHNQVFSHTNRQQQL